MRGNGWQLGVVIALVGAAPFAQAFQINPVYADPEAWTLQQQALIGQAMQDWMAVTSATAPSQHMDVAFYRVNAGIGSYLGQWQFGGQIPTAFPYSPGLVHSVYLNADYFSSMSFSAEAPPADAYDFLTIVRHELGHAMGFTDRVYLDGGIDRWASHIVDGTFDPGGLNVPMRTDGTHVALTDDLMYYQLPKGIRREISSTDVGMLQLAYGYAAVPEPASLALLGLGVLVVMRRRRLWGG